MRSYPPYNGKGVDSQYYPTTGGQGNNRVHVYTYADQHGRGRSGGVAIRHVGAVSSLQEWRCGHRAQGTRGRHPVPQDAARSLQMLMANTFDH